MMLVTWYVARTTEISSTIPGNPQLLETSSYKLGGFCIYFGVMLFVNLYLFFSGRRISRERAKLQQLPQ
ncbi:hypothetical protein MKQ70_04660 [Chitinophaga sedimenti]|uniref:hypothetical protein n=1 Tax=Chitinophaga sedimenti TaxID=2033606 RepID=UPI002003CA03|nr:hypothetical protein [Chitinophaga sedimenti]MCK7554335.1 hypothetical protein [Chitinophaga sedimenti]